MNLLRRPAFFTLVLLAFVQAILAATPRLGRIARMVPLIVAVPTAALLAGQVALDLTPRRGETRRQPERAGWPPSGRSARRAEGECGPMRVSSLPGSAVARLGWALLLPVMIYFLGFFVAVPLHCMIQLRRFSGERWTLSLIIPAALCGLLVLIARIVPTVPLWQGWLWMRWELR
jgi:hypothetical protein